MLNELEQQLFRSAEHARSNEVQRALLESRKRISANRTHLAPAMLERIEEALASLPEPVKADVPEAAPPPFSALALVDTEAMDETVALREIATRAEIRNSLPLFLLGQRLGVVAGRPAFDAERLPIGPRQLCRMLGESIAVFDLDASQRGVVFGQFDRSVMQFFGEFLETLNNYLIQQKILPHLTYVAPRNRNPQRGRDAPTASPGPRPGMDPAAAGPAGGRAAAQASAGPGMFAQVGSAPSAHAPGAGADAATGSGLFAPQRGSAPRPGTAPAASREPAAPESGAEDVVLFDTLRRLLAGRRSLLDRLQTNTITGPVANPAQIQDSLGALQARLNAQWAKGVSVPLGDLRREITAHLAAHAVDGRIPQLSGAQGDTVDLVGMLFEQIAQEVQPQTPGGQLLGQLQLPLLRVALQDPGFFSDRTHPARQLLTTITETSAYWSSEDEVDRDLIRKMGTVVRQVCESPEADTARLREMVDDLGSHLSTQQHRAEVAERRHVEAARGREKLEIARLKAEEAISRLVAGKVVPKFLKTLLEQVWTDVLALALLRGGDNAPAFRQYLGLAETLVAAALPNEKRVALTPTELAQIRGEVEAALAQVGHSGDEARAFSLRLSSVVSGAGDSRDTETTAEPASRTELTLRLRTRARLGEDVKGGAATAERQDTRAEKTAPLSPEEKVWHERLKRIAFGTWFDFTISQQGVKARRRLSWYSTITDHCLFVNHRGQRAGDYSLSWLAREICRGNVSVVEPESGSIVDRAWKAIVTALRSFSGGGAEPTPAAS